MAFQHMLHASVTYAGEVHAWEPAGAELVALTQDNRLLATQRGILAAEFPRRRFETALSITVGGLRADKGTEYAGRLRPEGLAKLDALLQTRKLGVVKGGHGLGTVSDAGDHSGRESTSVGVWASFTRPHQPEAPCRVSVFVNLAGSLGERHAPALVDAAWHTFRLLVELAPIQAAYAYWDEQLNEYRKPAPGEAGVAAFLWLDAARASALGGGPRIAEMTSAFDWGGVGGAAENGVVLQLSRLPEDMDRARLEVLRGALSNR